MWPVLALHSSLHRGCNRDHADNDDRSIWTQIKACSFFMHSTSIGPHSALQRILQGPLPTHILSVLSQGRRIFTTFMLGFITSVFRQGGDHFYLNIRFLEESFSFAGCKGQGRFWWKNGLDGTQHTKCHWGIQPSLFATTGSWRRGVEFDAAINKCHHVKLSTSHFTSLLLHIVFLLHEFCR